MPRPKKKKYRNYFGTNPFDDLVPKIKLNPEIKKGISVVIFLAFGVISLLSLFQSAGLIGEYIDSFFTALLGYGHWYAPLILLWLGYLLYAKEKRAVRGAVYLGLVFLIFSLQGLFHIFYNQADWDVIIQQGNGGGYLGLLVATVFVKLAGFWASLIILFGLLLISWMLILNKTLNSLVGSESIFAKILAPFNWLVNKIFRRGNEEEEEESEEENEEEESEEEESADAEAMADEEEDEEADEEEDEEGEFERKEIKLEPMEAKKIEPKKAKVESIWTPTNIEIDFPLDYLSSKTGKSVAGDIKTNKEIIKQTLDNFGIQVEMGDVEVGPTVTRYTLKPADGIMLSRITQLNNNLALALAARSIRIEAPIMGKALVGIEVPNASTAIVGLKEILVSEAMEERKNNMMLALGKDVSGEATVYDLTETPHLLVAGQTKSGKSVGINAMILGLLYQNSPDDLRFIMVDPKRVELPVYDNIPHLLCPVVTNVPNTVNVLSWLLNEMDRRLDIMMYGKCRNIQSYNAKYKSKKMPYIVLVIDELADLMLTARKEVEGKLIRLLQMSRAAGIHLILATQRPSADIITGVIKTNMPARISFAVKSGIDSRTILDEMGAEKLLGKGDMLFMATEYPKAKRLQGAFVSESEVKKIVSHLIAEGGEGAGYLEGITDKQKVVGIGGHGLSDNGGADDGEGGSADPLLSEAIEIVINSGKASTSYLQRRMSIGYGRAARMIDLIEQEGIIGPANGSKAREILVSKEQYERSMDQGVSGVSIHDRDSFVPPDSFLNVEIDSDGNPDDDGEDFAEAEDEILEVIHEDHEDVDDEVVVEEESESADADAMADEGGEVEEELIEEEDDEVEEGEDPTSLKLRGAREIEAEAKPAIKTKTSKEKAVAVKKKKENKIIEEDTDGDDKSSSSDDEEYERLFSR